VHVGAGEVDDPSPATGRSARCATGTGERGPASHRSERCDRRTRKAPIGERRPTPRGRPPVRRRSTTRACASPCALHCTELCALQCALCAHCAHRGAASGWWTNGDRPHGAIPGIGAQHRRPAPGDEHGWNAHSQPVNGVASGAETLDVLHTGPPRPAPWRTGPAVARGIAVVTVASQSIPTARARPLQPGGSTSGRPAARTAHGPAGPAGPVADRPGVTRDGRAASASGVAPGLSDLRRPDAGTRRAAAVLRIAVHIPRAGEISTVVMNPPIFVIYITVRVTHGWSRRCCPWMSLGGFVQVYRSDLRIL
jgi:hypothetical protein